MHRAVIGLLAGCLFVALASSGNTNGGQQYRTVILTDDEQDDLVSMIRHLASDNEVDIQGVIYATSSRRGIENGTNMTSSVGNKSGEYITLQLSRQVDQSCRHERKVRQAYTDVHRTMLVPDDMSRSQAKILAKIQTVNIEDETPKDAEGLALIRSLLLDQDRRTLYVQGWSGLYAIAHPLRVLESEYPGPKNLKRWTKLKRRVSKKVIILTDTTRDDEHFSYISSKWPHIRFHDLYQRHRHSDIQLQQYDEIRRCSIST